MPPFLLPILAATVLPAVLLLALSWVLHVTSDKGDWLIRHRVGYGVPTRVIFQRLDAERLLDDLDSLAGSRL